MEHSFCGWAWDDEEFNKARQNSEDNNSTWFKCSHCEHIDTGFRWVYCKFCGHKGHWVYDKEKGRVVEWAKT